MICTNPNIAMLILVICIVPSARCVLELSILDWASIFSCIYFPFVSLYCRYVLVVL